MKINLNSLGEAELWNLVSQGNLESFAFIFNTYSRDLYRYGHKFTQEVDLIEDVIQDVFVCLWESRDKLTIQKSIKFYLFSSFRREVIRRLQENRKQDVLEEHHSNISWEESFQEMLIENQITLESSKKISTALDNLSTRQKEAIYLRYIQGLSYEEISGLMGIQVASLYNLVLRGLKSMKQFLSSSDFTAKVVALSALFL